MTRTSTKWRTLRLLVPGALLTLAALAIVASPAFAGTLTNVELDGLQLQVSKTAVTYSFAFTTATAGTIKTVTMTVPSGTAGTPAVGTVYGLGAGTRRSPAPRSPTP